MKKLPKLIGVIHLPALPGSPGASHRSRSDLPSTTVLQAGEQAVHEAQVLEKLGYGAVILENFGDAPFFKNQVGPETIAAMSIIAAAVRGAVNIPVGINVLRNDAHAALAIACVSDCDFLRVNILSGVAATDQGWIEGTAASLLRERARIGANTFIFADILVKHAVTYSSSEPEIALEEVVGRGGAHAVIFTGSTTGRLRSIEDLKHLSRIAKNHRVQSYVGSGASLENLMALLDLGLGVIVGSSIKVGGKPGNKLDPKRAKAFAQAFKKFSK